MCEVAFGHRDLDWQEFVVQDPRFMRPAEVDILIGNAGKARQKLGWKPSIPFEELVRKMVDSDIRLLKRENGLA